MMGSQCCHLNSVLSVCTVRNIHAVVILELFVVAVPIFLAVLSLLAKFCSAFVVVLLETFSLPLLLEVVGAFLLPLCAFFLLLVQHSSCFLHLIASSFFLLLIVSSDALL